MNEKKVLGISTIAVIALILIVVGATYAFFKGTDAVDTDTPLEVTTNTTDSLIFNVDTDITMVADMSNFTEGAGNREGVANATATLKANNKTNSATGNYYLYLTIKENGLKYTTEAKTAELLLQINGPDGVVTTIDGLNYVTVTDGLGHNISGFDITEVQDLITIVSNKEITTTSEKTDNWEIKVVLVNLNENQSSNGGKKFIGELIIQKEKYKFPLLTEYIKSLYTGVQGDNNIYFHKNLANSTEDESYRYAGSYESVNNYVCFGYDGSDECPWNNMYRIIGVFDNQVKLIKADYAKSSELGTDGDYYNSFLESESGYGWSWGTTKGKNTKEEIGAYYRNESGLYQKNLNDNLLKSYDISWQEKIAQHNWNVGYVKVYNMQIPYEMYQNEIMPSEERYYVNKIGLMYISDYLYSSIPSNWLKYTVNIGHYDTDYSSTNNENWMYNGLMEWTMVSTEELGLTISDSGNIGNYIDSMYEIAVRPCFYLIPEVTVIKGTGTQENPYNIE